MIGIVTALEGEPLPSGDIASRLGGFDDVAAMEQRDGGDRSDAEIIEVLLGSKNDAAQQLPGLPGVPRRRRQDRPAARPAALRRVPAEPVPRARRDGADARRQPGRGRGHQGATSACRRSTRRARSSSSARSCGPATAASGRSRCAPASTRSTRACYAAEIVPTSILTLNWADAIVDGAQPRRAPVADRGARAARASCSASTCRCRSTCPTRKAPKVISMVGTMQNLVNEVLQSAVGNHFRNTLQDARSGDASSRPACRCSRRALEAITRVPRRVRRRDQGRLHPGRRVPRRSSSRC